jgi:hypothetical protein
MKDKKFQRNIERRFSGLYSLLRLSQEPSDKEINDAADKYLDFISQRYDIQDEDHILNEKYFINVFMAMKHSKNPIILRKLLRVVKFYNTLDLSKN